MDLGEFGVVIDDIEGEIECGLSVCESFDEIDENRIGVSFIKVMKPWYRDKSTYWYGDCSKKNIPKRIKALRKFEKIAIKKKLYLEY